MLAIYIQFVLDVSILMTHNMCVTVHPVHIAQLTYYVTFMEETFSRLLEFNPEFIAIFNLGLYALFHTIVESLS